MKKFFLLVWIGFFFLFNSWFLKKANAEMNQDLSGSVLAINTNKGIYQPGETVKISLAILDEDGKMACDASLKLKITHLAISGQANDILSTENGQIRVNPECQVYDYVVRPDFEAEYLAKEKGVYELELTAETKKGKRAITSSFEVKESAPFKIERETSTRIYPVKEYPVEITIKANQDFKGEIVERIPDSFELKSQNLDAKTTMQNSKLIVWSADWKKGEAYILKYQYDASDESPEYYELGPLRLVDQSGQTIFEETRTWQIASDAEVAVDTAALDTTDEFGASPATVFTSDQVGYQFFVQADRLYDATYEYGPSPSVVFIDDQVGYVFFVNVTGALVYQKTVDAGANWSGSTVIDGEIGWVTASVWYDQWTPGDTTGTLIHIAASNYEEDSIFYSYLDTSDDSLKSGGMVTVISGTTLTVAADGPPSITKSAEGNLFISANFTSTAGGKVSKSADGDEWTDITPSGWSTVAIDQIQLLPLLTDDDIIAIKAETATNYIKYQIYDEQTNNWAGSWSDIAALTENTTDDQWFSATIKKSTGDVYLALNDYTANSSNNMEFWSFDDSNRGPGFTQGGSLFSGDATVLSATPIVNESNGDIYVVYARGTINATTSIYFKKSTNGGTSWSDESSALNSTAADDFRYVRGNLLSGDILYAVWYNDDTNHLKGNALVDSPGSEHSITATGALVYKKTVDGGTNWSAKIIDAASSTGWTNVSVWYDQWTPEDTTGTLIHIAAAENENSNVYYTYLDVSTDTLRGSLTLVLDGNTFTPAVNAAPSITKSGEDNLFIAANFADYSGSAGGAVAKSANGTDWTAYTTGWSSASADQIQLLPLLTGYDVIALKADTGSNYIRYQIYDEETNAWAGSWSELSGSAISLIDNSTYDQWFSASIKKSTGDVYLSFASRTANGENDIAFWVFDESEGTWSQGADLFTNDATVLSPVPLIDENNGDIYVAYLRGTLGSITNVYFKKFTDSGATWSSELQQLSTTAVGDDYRYLKGNLFSSDRLFIVYYDDDDNVIYGSTILSQDIGVESYIDDAVVDASDDYGPAPSTVFTDDQTGYTFYVDPEAIYDATGEYGASPAVVFTSSTTGYVFFVDNISQDLVYRKTVDGGVTWSVSVVIDTAVSGWVTPAVWYDQWTPGDTTGTLIHIAASDNSSDDIYYTYLDTSDDSLRSGGVVTAVSGTTTITLGTDGPPSITKGGGDYLFICANFTSTAGGKVSKSINGGDNWTDITPSGWSTLAVDQIQLLPLLAGDDIIAIRADTANDNIDYQVYDEDGDTNWAGSWTSISSMVDNGTYDQWFSASIKKSSADVYLTFTTNLSVSTGDIEFWTFDESARTWAQNANVIDNDATVLAPVPLIEEDTGNIYVAYLRGTLAGSMRVYYKSSSNGGSTWSDASSTISPTTTDDFKTLRGNLLNNDILYVIWHNDDTNTIKGNNLLSPSSIDNPVTGQSLVYRKTTDGGLIWGTTNYVAVLGGTTSLAVWYDQWTPEDTTGTLIHIAFSDDETDDYYYTYLDTSDDTLRNIFPVSVLLGTAITEAAVGVPGITKSAEGNLFLSGNFNTTAGGKVSKSADGDEWTDITPSGWSSAALDQIQLLPLLTRYDVIALKADTGSNYIRYQIYDEETNAWAGSWSELSGSAIALTDNSTYDQWFSASIKKSTGDVYLTFANNTANSANDIAFWVFDESEGTWSQGADLFTNDATVLSPVPLIDETSGDIYVAYLRGTLASSVGVYYKKSTDGGANWGSESENLSPGILDDHRTLRGNCLNTKRLYVVWHNDDLNDIMGNTVYYASNVAPGVPTLLFVNEIDCSLGVASPSVVGNSTPVFSALYNDDDEGDVAENYQLIIYSDSGCTSSVWDSTKTAMSSCTEPNRCLTVTGLGMEYGGTALAFNGVKYYWKIRFWDDDDAQGELSSCNNFTILGPADQLRHGNYFFNKTTERVFTW
jgi:hypothetical protein